MRRVDAGGPQSLLLVHGAGSGPWVFEGWADALRPLPVHAVDLQAGLVVAEASMGNYAAAVAAAAGLLEPPVALVGWSMGGLAAMLAAERAEAAALVLLEASPPAEVQGVDPDVEVAPGEYDPETEYGPFPDAVRARPESALARAERRRGISVPRLPERTLVVYGREFADDRGRRLAAVYAAEALEVRGASHWDLVLDARARGEAVDFIVRG